MATYVTISELEAYTSYDYSEINSRYTDVIIDAVITQAERIVNSYTRQSWSSQNVPDNIKGATLEIAARLMHNRMVADKVIESEYADITIKGDPILEVLLDTGRDAIIDSVEMNTIAYGDWWWVQP